MTVIPSGVGGTSEAGFNQASVVSEMNVIRGHNKGLINFSKIHVYDRGIQHPASSLVLTLQSEAKGVSYKVQWYDFIG